MQVIIPLGSKPGLRAGKTPEQDEKACPPGGEVQHTLTEETVCVRKQPDLDSLEKDLKQLRKVSVPQGEVAHMPQHRCSGPLSNLLLGADMMLSLLTKHWSM